MPESEKVLLNVEGMTCSNCALGISRFLEKKGLSDVMVDFTSGEVSFDEIPSEMMDEVVSGINTLGYKVVNPNQEAASGADESFFSTIEFRFLICAILTIPLLLHMVWNLPLLSDPFFQLALCTPVMFIGLSYFGKSALASLKTGIPNMDVLIVTGSGAAYIYSTAGMYLYQGTPELHQYLFFETTATIITLVLLGNIIEKRSVRQTGSALRELAAMQPLTASKIFINTDFSETVQQVDISAIKKNDPVLIQSGGSVPVDGKIYWGEVVVDESMLSGESVPVEKGEGDPVYAGTLVHSGTAKVVTEKAGKQTALAGIIDLVKQAQQSKPKIQKLGDKVSAWFVPVVISISLLTFAGGYFVFDKSLTTALMSAIAVLVISCPCAMGLATPTAVAVGLGKAAREGILVKGGSVLELFDNITTAVFDKTGTLTTGNFKVSSLECKGISEQEAINIIYSLEQHSNHPIALSLTKEFESRKTKWIAFDKVDEQKGAGIKASDTTRTYSLGSSRMFRNDGPPGDHSLYLAIDDSVVATIDITDEIKAGAGLLVEALKNKGIQPVLLSGDNELRCREVGQQLGISEIYHSKLPDEKTRIISELKPKGRVLMVGDGINDAPSLATADIGISFSEATRIAINSAQVVILNNSNLNIILDALKIGKQTLTTIRQNLFWAFAYNLVAIPVAAMGYLSPMVAAFSMAFSDVVVIGNSIRLRFRK